MKLHINFFDVFQDAEDFRFKGINLSKYYYDLFALKTSLGDIDSSAINNWNPHEFLKRPYLVATGLVKWISILLTVRHKTIFFGNENRIIEENGTRFDLYNYKIIRAIGDEKVLVMQDRHDKITGKVFTPNLVIDDLTPFLFLLEKFFSIISGKEIFRFRSNLEKNIAHIGFSKKVFTAKLLKFYTRYLFYLFFLKVIKPKSAILICHYSKHAFIAACKRLGIPTFELQHGLITPSHGIYNLPKIPKKYKTSFINFVLPDFLAVYGQYWREVAMKGGLFPSRAIVTIGDYLKIETGNKQPVSSGKKTILISSQAPVQGQIIKYIRFLQANLDPTSWRVIVKPHPIEKDNAYQEVAKSGLLEVSHDDIYRLLQHAEVHISVYSTVLYEAVRYDLVNYCLYVEAFREHCDEILASHVARRLDQGILPAICRKKDKGCSFKYYFDAFHPEIFLRILES